MNRVVISLGSNIDPQSNIAAALRILEQHWTVLAVSALVETEPVGPPGQPFFVNGATAIETPLDPSQLKTALRNIESQLGRVRSRNKYAPRPIDLDIVVWNNVVIERDYYQREFLRAAINEVMPVTGSLVCDSLPNQIEATGAKNSDNTITSADTAVGSCQPCLTPLT